MSKIIDYKFYAKLGEEFFNEKKPTKCPERKGCDYIVNALKNEEITQEESRNYQIRICYSYPEACGKYNKE